jgi:CDP-4-dehydro-6-deoxyglucose reductase, E3
MTSVVLTSGKTFPAASNVSILDAAIESGVSLPYSCKTGRCSACKCMVIEGETRALQEEKGLSDAEKEEGWILSCVRSALTNLHLNVEDLGVALPSVVTLPLRIDSIEKVALDVIRVILRVPPSSTFSFVPGQFIEIIAPGGIRRSYSLAKASASDKKIELHIRAVSGGAMSRYWFERAEVNDLLRLNGPLGTFFLRDIAGLDVVFLATGTGIAPVKAMLESIVNIDLALRPSSVSVFWGGRIENDLYLDMKSIFPDFNFIPVLSRAGLEWRGARGHVQQVLPSILPDLSCAAVYACGSDAMIRTAKATLIDSGLSSKRFYSDAFVSSGSI